MIKQGNILDAEEQYICHQCNCVTETSYGLATQIFQKFPHANTYILRKKNQYSTQSLPSTISVHKNIINMYSQYGPGKSLKDFPASEAEHGKPNSFNDSYELRKKWFADCLLEISKLKPISIALPFNIGCGLAGGKWADYEEMLNTFCKENPEVKVVLYKL